MKRAGPPLLAFALLSACADFPKDAANSLAEARTGRPLRVGWSVAEPWVRDEGGRPAGIEPELLRRWAATEGLRLEWIRGGEAQLVEGLAEDSLDMAVAGFTKQAPWGGRIGQTLPYLEARLVIGAPTGTTSPPDWENVPVAHDPGRPQVAAALFKQKAVPTTGAALFRAAYEPELAAAGLVPTETKLSTEQHTIATAPSANALTLSLDRFLHAHRGAIEQRLASEGRR